MKRRTMVDPRFESKQEMNDRVNRARLAAFAAFLLPLACLAQEPKKQIKVLRVGSSSFPYMLVETARAIVEASGRYELVCAKEDATGYTRLDQFISQPGLYEEWCHEQGPRIQAGDYDFVIVQTIGWLGMKPEQQERLCTEILPDLARRIRDAGAQVILYDKYVPIDFDQKDPRARTWCERYPHGYKLNYLLHIMAAKHARIERISFGGQTVTELWQHEHFRRQSFLYCDSSHPGPMAHYISALNLAYLLTEEDPVGNPARELPLGDGRERTFFQLPNSPKPGAVELFEENKGRIHDGILTLTESEATILQEAAMRSQRQWGSLLQACLESDEKFAEVVQETRRIQSEMGNYEKYGLDAARVANLRAKFAPPAAPGELPPSLIAKMRRKSRSIEYAGAEVRNYYRRFLTREQQKMVAEAFANHWTENNSKLRDDLYFGSRVLIEKALKSGARDEASRLQQASSVLHMTLSFPAFMLLFDNVSDENKKVILENYRITGVKKRTSPVIAAYQNEHHLDETRLTNAWRVYMDIWSDPDLMDKLRDSDFSLGVIQEADREFAKRLAE